MIILLEMLLGMWLLISLPSGCEPVLVIKVEINGNEIIITLMKVIISKLSPDCNEVYTALQEEQKEVLCG